MGNHQLSYIYLFSACILLAITSTNTRHLPDELIRDLEVPDELLQHGRVDHRAVSDWLKSRVGVQPDNSAIEHIYEFLDSLADLDGRECDTSFRSHVRELMPAFSGAKLTATPLANYFTHFTKAKLSKCTQRGVAEFECQSKYVGEWALDQFFEAALGSNSHVDTEGMLARVQNFNPLSTQYDGLNAARVASALVRFFVNTNSRPLQGALLNQRWIDWKLELLASFGLEKYSKGVALGDCVQNIDSFMVHQCWNMRTIIKPTFELVDLGAKFGLQPDLNSLRLKKVLEYRRICNEWNGHKDQVRANLARGFKGTECESQG